MGLISTLLIARTNNRSLLAKLAFKRLRQERSLKAKFEYKVFARSEVIAINTTMYTLKYFKLLIMTTSCSF